MHVYVFVPGFVVGREWSSAFACGESVDSRSIGCSIGVMILFELSRAFISTGIVG